MIFYLYFIQQNYVVSMEVNRYSYGVQFGINCTALNQSKLSNFVECTVKGVITQVISKSDVSTKHKFDFELQVQLLPELYGTRSNY